MDKIDEAKKGNAFNFPQSCQRDKFQVGCCYYDCGEIRKIVDEWIINSIIPHITTRNPRQNGHHLVYIKNVASLWLWIILGK